MDASKQEILSVIEGEQAKLKVADAEQKLKEAEAKLKAIVLRRRQIMLASNKSTIRRLSKCSWMSAAGFSFFARSAGRCGCAAKPLAAAGRPHSFKAGDRAWPGAGIAELPDPSKLKISARIEEAERGQLKLGQTATIRVDAVPDVSFGGPHRHYQSHQRAWISTPDGLFPGISPSESGFGKQ